MTETISAPVPAATESTPASPDGATPADIDTPDDTSDRLVLTGKDKRLGRRLYEKFEQLTWRAAEAKKYGFDILDFDKTIGKGTPPVIEDGKVIQKGRQSAVDRFYAQFEAKQEPGTRVEIMDFAAKEFPIDESKMSAEEVELQEQRRLSFEAILHRGPRRIEKMRENWKHYLDLGKGLVYDDILRDQHSEFLSRDAFTEERIAANEARAAEQAKDSPYAAAYEYGFHLMDRNEVNEVYDSFGKKLGRMRDINLRDRKSDDPEVRDRVKQAIRDAATAYVDQEEYFQVEKGDSRKLRKLQNTRREKLIKYLSLSPKERDEIDQQWEEYDLQDAADSWEEAHRINEEKTRQAGRSVLSSLLTDVPTGWTVDAAFAAYQNAKASESSSAPEPTGQMEGEESDGGEESSPEEPPKTTDNKPSQSSETDEPSPIEGATSEEQDDDKDDEPETKSNFWTAPYRRLERRYGKERARSILRMGGAAATAAGIIAAGVVWTRNRSSRR